MIAIALAKPSKILSAYLITAVTIRPPMVFKQITVHTIASYPWINDTFRYSVMEFIQFWTNVGPWMLLMYIDFNHRMLQILRSTVSQIGKFYLNFQLIYSLGKIRPRKLLLGRSSKSRCRQIKCRIFQVVCFESKQTFCWFSEALFEVDVSKCVCETCHENQYETFKVWSLREIAKDTLFPCEGFLG